VLLAVVWIIDGIFEVSWCPATLHARKKCPYSTDAIFEDHLQGRIRFALAWGLGGSDDQVVYRGNFVSASAMSPSVGVSY
jgi:hypothetical protein